MIAVALRKEGPWLAGILAAAIAGSLAAGGADDPAETSGLADYSGLGDARVIHLDAAATLAANEAAYGDMTRLPDLCDLAQSTTGPTWIEYAPADRLAWYAGEPAPADPRGPMPERVGVLASRDGRGRLSIDHAFVREGRVEFCPWTAKVNARGAEAPEHETTVALPDDYVGRTIGPEGVAGKRALLARLSFDLNAYGADLVAQVREFRPDLMDVMVNESLSDAEEEATFALAMLALHDRADRATAS